MTTGGLAPGWYPEVMPRPALLAAALAPCLSAALLLATPREARAAVFLGAELEGAQGLGLPGGPGVGFAGALGYRIGIGPVFLQPEAQGSYMIFPRDTVGASHILRILGGARVGLSGRFQPAIFGHAGAGWFDADTNGPAFDVGLAMGFRLIPLLRFGAQAGYNVMMLASPSAVARWVSYGAHVGVEF